MSRAIPRAAKDEAFKLWLGGCSYREIRDKTGMSLGAINQLIDEARRTSPDLDQLRELSIVLNKVSSSVYDAIRGGRLLDVMNKMGMDIDQIDGYVKLIEKLTSERGVDVEGFVGSALKTMRLEVETGKTYMEIIKDFEEKRTETEKLTAKKVDIEEKIRVLEDKLAQVNEGLSSTVQRLKSTVETEERLKKIGLEKTANLAEFIEGYENLGFGAEEVQRLATWRKDLAAMGIDPDKLGEHIKERGSLEKQISNLRREKSAREREVKQQKEEHLRLWSLMTNLKGEVSNLSTLRSVLKGRKILMTCKICGAPASVFMNLPNRKEIETMVKSGLVMYVGCPRCGGQPFYTATDILCCQYLSIFSLAYSSGTA